MNTPTTPPPPDTPDTPDFQDVPATPQSPDTRADDTLADEVFVDDGRTAALPTPVAPESAAPAPAPTAPPEPVWLTGPAPFALVLGLLGLLVAGTMLLTELTDWTLPWGDLGPWSVVAAGVVVLLVGAIGRRSSRSRK